MICSLYLIRISGSDQGIIQWLWFAPYKIMVYYDFLKFWLSEIDYTINAHTMHLKWYYETGSSLQMYIGLITLSLFWVSYSQTTWWWASSCNTYRKATLECLATLLLNQNLHFLTGSGKSSEMFGAIYSSL